MAKRPDMPVPQRGQGGGSIEQRLLDCLNKQAYLAETVKVLAERSACFRDKVEIKVEVLTEIDGSESSVLERLDLLAAEQEALTAYVNALTDSFN